MRKFHDIKNVNIEKGILNLTVNGTHIQKTLDELSPTLAKATEEEQKEFDISPSGYGIHWPLIDEDISIDGLLGVNHNPSQHKKSA